MRCYKMGDAVISASRLSTSLLKTRPSLPLQQLPSEITMWVVRAFSRKLAAVDLCREPLRPADASENSMETQS